MSQEINQPKRRGRKPKGGKLVSKNVSTNKSKDLLEPQSSAVIVHIKCTTSDIREPNYDLEYNPSIESVQPYSDVLNINKYEHFESENEDMSTTNTNLCNESLDKLIHLNLKLDNMKISNIKSACFWCTCDFTNNPVHIPKQISDSSLYVYWIY